LAEKIDKNKLSSRVFPSNFLSRFFAVSLHEEPKTTTKMFSKTIPEIFPQKNQNK
jgi:hypothetical protein